jgi:hypothetical protein
MVDDGPRHAAVGPRVSEQRAEIEGAGEQIEYQFEVQIFACRASNTGSVRRVAHRFASGGEHLTSDSLR